MTKTEWPVLRVRDKNVFFKLVPVAQEDGSFKTYVEDGENSILIMKSKSFEDMMESFNALHTAFGVLGYTVEHRF